MPKHNSIFLLLLAIALWLGGIPAQVVAYHDQTSAQHQNQVNTLGGTGYRMITLSIYDDPLNPRYAAVWVHRSGPAWVAFHGADAATFQALRSAWSSQSYIPKILAATGSGSSIRFAGVFEYDPVFGYSSYNLSQAGFDLQCKNARDNGYRLITATVYGTALSPLFAGAWRNNTENYSWAYTHSADANVYQTDFNAFTAGWTRPVHVTLSSYGRYLSIWHDNQLQNSWVAAHDMTSAGYQSMVTTQSSAGRYPICVQAGGLGGATRFAAIFASSETVTGRNWTVTGTAVPELSGFDAYVQQLMQGDDIRGASLAVIKDGRLMLARGYTWAEPGYPVTQPTSLFRIASASKALTSIGIHHLMAAPFSPVNDNRTMLSFFPAIAPLDPLTNNVTLLHLLTHRGGWDISALGFDPAFYDWNINNFYGGTLPITKDDIYQYMTTQKPLQFVPGAYPGAYSNYGFMMLGKVLERSNPGMTYEQIIKRDVFTPLGVTRARIGGSLLAQAAAGEVRYHPVGPYIASSVLTPAQPIVPGQYGGWNQGNLDAEGGWIMAAPDYAKVLAAFSLGDGNPVLNTAWTNHMWSTVSASYPNLLRGWYKTDVLSNGTWKVLHHHNGELPGTATFCCVRSDNVGFCLFINRDHWLGDNPHGIDLSGIADQVVQWPNNDLFPSVGIPSLYTHVGGTFTAYGSGCAGSAGVPSHTGLGTSEVGYSFSLRVANVPSSTFGIACVGSSKTNWMGIPLPAAVAGAPGCSLRAAPDITIATLTNAGVGVVPVDVPMNQSLIGLRLYSQYAVLDASANSLGLSFSNGLDTLIGGWQ